MTISRNVKSFYNYLTFLLSVEPVGVSVGRGSSSGGARDVNLQDVGGRSLILYSINHVHRRDAIER